MFKKIFSIKHIKNRYYYSNNNNPKSSNIHLYINVIFGGGFICGLTGYICKRKYDKYIESHNLLDVPINERDYYICKKYTRCNSGNIRHVNFCLLRQILTEDCDNKLQELKQLSLRNNNGNNITKIPIIEWNYELICTAVTNGFDNLSLVPPKYRDKKLCLLFVKKCIDNLKFVPSDIINEKIITIVKKRIHENPNIAKFIPLKYWTWDKSFMYRLAKISPFCGAVSIPNIYLEKDEKLCKLVISCPDKTLHYLPKSARMKRDIYTIALMYCADNLNVVLKDFCDNPEVIEEACLIAINTSYTCYYDIPTAYITPKINEYAKKIGIITNNKL